MAVAELLPALTSAVLEYLPVSYDLIYIQFPSTSVA